MRRATKSSDCKLQGLTPIRVNQVTDPLSRAVNFEYNGGNQITKLTTHVGTTAREKRFQYESEHGTSRLKHIVSPLGKHVDFTYAFRGNVQAVTNIYGTVQYGYDNLLRLTSATFPNGGITVSYWDVLGNVNTAARTTTDGQNCSYTYDQYDALNRVTQLNASLAVPGFTNASYTLGYQYDADGKVTQRIFTRLATTITATYGYDTMDRLTSVSESAGGALTATAGYQYDSAGRRWLTGYGNADQVERLYDAESRLRNLTVRNGATTVKALVYVPDAMGHLQSITADGAQTAYAYDAGYQLIREVLPNGGDVNEWDYDGAGNMVAARRPGVSTGYLVNNDDELTEASGTTTVTGQVTGGPNNNKWYNSWAECRGVRARVSTVNGSFSLAGVPVYAGANALQVTVTDASGNQTTQTRNVTNTLSYAAVYDGNGNLTSRTNTQGAWVYTWNALNQLVSASLGGATVLQNWYDAYGRRIAKQEVIGGATNKWYYVYDGWAVIAVLNGTNGALVESYTRGVGLAGDVGTLIAARHHAGTYNNQVIYLHSNHRGDVILARSGATTIGACDYAPYGALRSTSGAYDSRFKFSSKERDASADVYYFGFRFYDPNLQRWLNRDPLGEAGGINLYQYAGNSPVNFVDAYGLQFYRYMEREVRPPCPPRYGPRQATEEEVFSSVEYLKRNGLPRNMAWNAPRIPVGSLVPPEESIPGTPVFGNQMHARIKTMLERMYPHTQFYFRIKPGETGVDVTVTGGANPGFRFAEIKPGNLRQQMRFNSQVENWGLKPGEVLPITYDPTGGVYFGF